MGIKSVLQMSVLIVLACLASPLTAYGQSHPSDQAQLADELSPSPSDQIEPQVVRVSYVQGDVRVARGKESERASGSDWDIAVAGLPLETGFNLATGAGRAEIEFEDASVIYLAENSVLAFNDLHSVGDLPYTEVALLSGTATLHVNRSGRQSFILNLPTARLTAGYESDSYLRLTAYTDGFAYATRIKTVTRLPDWPLPVAQSPSSGTLYFQGISRVEAPTGGDDTDFSAWDKWVEQRVAARSTAMTAVMKEAGLTAPIPGLADLNGKGKFFPCQPYGTCWEPIEQIEQPGEGAGLEQRTAASNDNPAVQNAGPAPATLVHQAVPPRRKPLPDLYNYFPCSPELIRYRGNRSGSLPVAADQLGLPPYDWTRCHAGFWIHSRGHYTWVAHHKIHHHCPVRWVKTGRMVGYVPLHPLDVRGKLPINRAHGILTVNKAHVVEAVSTGPRNPVKLLNSPPREFQKPVYVPLARAVAPHVELHQIGASKAPHVASPGPRDSHAVLAFDHKSQSFLVARQVTQHGKSTTVMQPFGGHTGALQARAGGVDSHGNYSMHGASGSSGSGGSSHGGSGSGGGSHSGGGSSGGGGGGSHSGGGGPSWRL